MKSYNTFSNFFFCSVEHGNNLQTFGKMHQMRENMHMLCIYTQLLLWQQNNRNFIHETSNICCD